MPGPPPKPTALRIVQGNPSKRKLNRDEPKFSGAPVCPDWLTTSAKEEWKRVTCELAALDMLRSVDSSALAAYCQSYARWKQAEQQIDKDGQTVDEPIVNKSGDVVGYKTKRHPATTISKDALASMLRASALFGFDPSSRSRLSVGEQNVSDPFEDFMRGIGADEEPYASDDPSPS
jgi:P27 family predicted phage terminase small subunit